MSAIRSLQRTTILVALLVSIFVLLAPQTARSSMPTATQSESTAASGLFFIENVGQFDKAARYQIAGSGQTVWLSDDAIWLSRTSFDPEMAAVLRRGELRAILGLEPDAAATQTTHVRLRLEGARLDGEAMPFGPQETRLNYYFGDEPDAWVSDAPCLARGQAGRYLPRCRVGAEWRSGSITRPPALRRILSGPRGRP